VQSEIKYLIVAFLFGVILFSLAYLFILWAIMDFDTYLIASKERLEWEEIFWAVKKEPARYLMSVKRVVLATLILGGGATLIFLVSLLWLIRGLQPIPGVEPDDPDA
jgi:hypothetical protein